MGWCGRLIDGNGTQFDPLNLSGLQKHLPQNAGELCKPVHCLQWMGNSIPDFANSVTPLRSILEEAHAKYGSRTNKYVQGIPLDSLPWNKGHEKLFREFQEEIHMTTLSHRNNEMVLCVYTDASDAYWAGAVTQTNADDLDKDLRDQRHDPLAFLGAAFKGS